MKQANGGPGQGGFGTKQSVGKAEQRVGIMYPRSLD